MRRRARTDANQTEIVKQLRRIPNLSVEITSRMGDGFPDIVVGYCGVNILLEIKDPEKSASRRKLTNDEEHFQRNWKGQYTVVSTIEDCVVALVYNIQPRDVVSLNIWTQGIWGISASDIVEKWVKQGV